MQGCRQDQKKSIPCRWKIFSAAIALSIVSGCEPPQIDPQSRSGGGPPEPVYADPGRLPQAEAEPVPQQRAATRSPAANTKKKQSNLDSIKPESVEGGGTLGDILLTPLRTYSKVKVRINEIQIKSQLNAFRAKNGSNPKDFEQYKKEILDPVGITLPELPDGDSYVYQPAEGRYGELMIRSRK
jgi:hypothetical protein